jgi:hypothetical protein
MVDSVTDQLSKLRFKGAPVETLYLDKTRVQEDFIGQIGAISSFVRAATKKGSGSLGLLPGGAAFSLGFEASSEANVTWNLDNPITQVLVLRAVLQEQNSVYCPDQAEPGRYVIFSGTGMVSRAAMFNDLHRERLQEHPDLYMRLEDERAKEEKEMLATDGPKENLWLLTISKGSSVCAATLLGNLLRPPFRHWVHADSHWEIFGLCRRIHETGVPWLAPLYLCAKF